MKSYNLKGTYIFSAGKNSFSPTQWKTTCVNVRRYVLFLIYWILRPCECEYFKNNFLRTRYFSPARCMIRWPRESGRYRNAGNHTASCEIDRSCLPGDLALRPLLSFLRALHWNKKSRDGEQRVARCLARFYRRLRGLAWASAARD